MPYALLEAHEISHIDYLSIDIEGGELEVLKGLNLSKREVRVVGVENNYPDFRIPWFMISNGYTFHSVVGDEFYVKR